MGILTWIGSAILVILSFVLLSIFGLVFVGIGFVAGYTDRGLGFSAGVSAVIYTIFFAILVRINNK